MSQALNIAKSSLGGAVRRDSFDGREHLVVPVVMIVDGVLNDALVTHEEYGKYVASWDGRPVPVRHPQKNGQYVSANAVDVLQKTVIGQILNTRAEAGKLKAEAWLDVEKAARLGYGDLVSNLEAGQTVEVSTGYFSDEETRSGSFNGNSYSKIHRNLRPDHLALLPDEVGACSIADGCGTRVNTRKNTMDKTKDAFTTLAAALGFRANCNCNGDDEMSDQLSALAEKLKANAKVTDDQLKVFNAMSLEDQEKLMPLFANESKEEVKDNEDEEEEEEKKPMTNASDIDALVANAVSEALEAKEKAEIITELKANTACIFDDKELAGMSVNSLKSYRKSIRPADYSGAGGVVVHSSDPVSQPLNINQGLQALIKSEASQ